MHLSLSIHTNPFTRRFAAVESLHVTAAEGVKTNMQTWRECCLPWGWSAILDAAEGALVVLGMVVLEVLGPMVVVGAVVVWGTLLAGSLRFRSLVSKMELKSWIMPAELNEGTVQWEVKCVLFDGSGADHLKVSSKGSGVELNFNGNQYWIEREQSILIHEGGWAWKSVFQVSRFSSPQKEGFKERVKETIV